MTSEDRGNRHEGAEMQKGNDEPKRPERKSIQVILVLLSPKPISVREKKVVARRVVKGIRKPNLNDHFSLFFRLLNSRSNTELRYQIVLAKLQ